MKSPNKIVYFILFYKIKKNYEQQICNYQQVNLKTKGIKKPDEQY